MRVTCYTLLCTVGMLMGMMASCRQTPATIPPPPARTNTPVNYARTPVIFVHGSGLNAKTWEPMLQHLVDVGYPPDYLKALNLIPNDGSSSRAAKEFIAPAIESALQDIQIVARKAGYSGKLPQRVDFVTHSMGAVSSRWYATQIRPERVRTWIAIAGANYGGDTICPYPSSGNSELCPAFATSAQKNPLQVTLNGTPTKPVDPTPYGLGQDAANVPRIPPDKTRNILYLTLRIDPDQWIKPIQSAIIGGAGGLSLKIPKGVPARETSPGNYLFTGQTEHDLLPQHPEVFRLVETMLTLRDQPDTKSP
jgi:pimeloyl-ACP methyl ester carboxylesterase